MINLVKGEIYAHVATGERLQVVEWDDDLRGVRCLRMSNREPCSTAPDRLHKPASPTHLDGAKIAAMSDNMHRDVYLD